MIEGWLLWRLPGQFSSKYLAQKHWIKPLKSIPPKESQIWLVGKETPGGIWWPPSEITINCFPLQTTYCQGLFFISIPVLTSPTPVFPVSLLHKFWIFLSTLSHQQRSHNSVLFVLTLCSVSLLWAGRCSSVRLCRLQVCSPQHTLPSTDRHLPSANTSGCHTPGNREKSRSEQASLNL